MELNIYFFKSNQTIFSLLEKYSNILQGEVMYISLISLSKHSANLKMSEHKLYTLIQ
jgi:hypothetical protein